jgi:hypothetical protein
MLLPRAGNEYRKLGDLESASPEEKIEVWSRSDEGGRLLLELVHLSWGGGIGWYVQKRLTLDEVQVDALRLLLGTGASGTGVDRSTRSTRSRRSEVPVRRTRETPRVVREENVLRLVFAR